MVESALCEFGEDFVAALRNQRRAVPLPCDRKAAAAITSRAPVILQKHPIKDT